MSNELTLRLLASAALALAAPAYAAPSPVLAGAAGTVHALSPSLHAGTLEVPLNKSEIVSTDVAIAKAMIGNDDIADVLPVSGRSIYVLGKKMGTTSLTLYDAAGRVISIMDVAVGPDVESLRAQLSQYVPDQPIEARISNDSVVLSGLVSDPGAASRAMQIARAFAGEKVINLVSVGSSQQVMLEVRFAEVNRSVGFDVGTNFAARSATGRFSGVTGQGVGYVPAVPGTVTTSTTNGVTTVTSTGGQPAFLSQVPIAGAFGVFRQRFDLGGLGIDAMLNVLENKGLAKTLAQPTLIALSGEKASFLAGGEFPVPVAQSGAGNGVGSQAITVEFKPFGVSLAFTPTVLGDRTINMIVEPEVSAIDPTASLTLGTITIPGLRTRRASTTLELRDGESFAIAGLLQQDFKTSVNQIPLLGSIPILGSLFRSSSFQKGETELLIIVTPRLVAPIRPGQVRLPTDTTGDPSAARTILLGDPSARKTLPPAAGTERLQTGAATPAPSSPQAAQTAELPATAAASKEQKYAY